MVRDHLVILRAAALFSVADAASTACRRHPTERTDTREIATQLPGADILRWMAGLLRIVRGDLE